MWRAVLLHCVCVLEKASVNMRVGRFCGAEYTMGAALLINNEDFFITRAPSTFSHFAVRCTAGRKYGTVYRRCGMYIARKKEGYGKIENV
jgi:hypothetical protein